MFWAWQTFFFPIFSSKGEILKHFEHLLQELQGFYIEQLKFKVLVEKVHPVRGDYNA